MEFLEVRILVFCLFFYYSNSALIEVQVGETGEEEEEEERQDSNSIFEQYKLGFTDEFADQNEEYDENEMAFESAGGFARPEYNHDEKSVRSYKNLVSYTHVF